MIELNRFPAGQYKRPEKISLYAFHGNHHLGFIKQQKDAKKW